MTIVLKDFWQSHQSDYFPDFPGDVTKEFLKDLASQILLSDNKPIVITSVHKTTSFTTRLITKTMSSEKTKNRMRYQGAISSEPSDGAFNIWYTAENIRPLLDSAYDAFLSYDLDTFGGKNHYLPLWLCRLGNTTKAANENQIALTRERKTPKGRSKNFAVVASNPEQIRSQFIQNLQRDERVEIFGKLGRKISNKNEILKQFNFNICFENDLYPGYVTEKAVEAYLSGCIPVWRGIDAGQFFNKDAIVDVTNLSVIDAVQEVRRISKNPKLMTKMRTAPLLRKTIDLDKIIVDLRKRYQDR